MKKYFILVFIFIFTNYIFPNENKAGYLKSKSDFNNNMIKFSKLTNDDKNILNPDLKYFKIFNRLGVGFLVSGGSLLIIGIPTIMVHIYNIYSPETNDKYQYTGSLTYYLMLSIMISSFSLGGIFCIISIISFIISAKYYKKYKESLKNTSLDFDYKVNDKNLTFSFSYKLS